jgi:hypothetical protein
MSRMRLSLVGEDASTETQDRRLCRCRPQLGDSGVETGIQQQFFRRWDITLDEARQECLGWLDLWNFENGISRVV